MLVNEMLTCTKIFIIIQDAFHIKQNDISFIANTGEFLQVAVSDKNFKLNSSTSYDDINLYNKNCRRDFRSIDNFFEPSLKEESRNTETYNISKLFYVAFFGGVVSMVFLGKFNCNSLKIDKRNIVVLGTLGVFILITRMAVYNMYLGHHFNLQSQPIRWGYRIASGLLYLGYYLAMRTKFNQHMVVDGTIKPLLKDAIIYILIGIAIESILLFAIGGRVLENAV